LDSDGTLCSSFSGGIFLNQSAKHVSDTFEPDGSKNDLRFVAAGAVLSEKEVCQLEKRIKENPSDVAIRLQLIGYYNKLDRFTESAFEHILWMIENRARDYVWYSTLSLSAHKLSSEQFAKFRERWLEQVATDKSDAKVNGNAAYSIGAKDFETSERLLRRAQKLNPRDVRWTRRLAQIYRHEALCGLQIHRAKYAKLAMTQTQRALSLRDAPGERVGLLMTVIPIAIDFGHLELARNWSKRFLDLGRKTDCPLWEQTACLYMARIKLAGQGSTQAKVWLRKALTSLKAEPKQDGPSHLFKSNRMMLLLDELLQRGEKEIVIDTLKLCERKTSGRERDQIKKWLASIRAGGKPALRFD